jgi:DNA-binding response OmpR family regulator
MNLPSPRRILLVEDEVMVAMMLEDMLSDMGHEIIGPAYNVSAGLALAQSAHIDLAILDVNLGDGDSAPIGDALVARKIPFILATGYGCAASNVHRVPILQKPYLSSDIEQALLTICAH